MQRRRFLSAAAGSAAALLSATAATVQGESSAVAGAAATGATAKVPAYKPRKSPSKSNYRRGATIMLVIPRDTFKPKSWRDVPSARVTDGPEPFDAESYIVINTIGGMSLAHARAMAKTFNKQVIRDGGEIAAWAIVAATDGRLVDRAELVEDDYLTTVYLVAIDNCNGRRWGKSTLDENEASEWAAIYNDFSERGRFDARATVIPCDANLQMALPAETSGAA